jgi:cephalosporin hydroxylase
MQITKLLINKLIVPCIYVMYRKWFRKRYTVDLNQKLHSMIVDEFGKLYYDSRTWMNTLWMGVPARKCPLDLWIYQEMISELRPDIIIETGTAGGGSALFMASICDLVAQGRDH